MINAEREPDLESANPEKMNQWLVYSPRAKAHTAIGGHRPP